ncbi:MAG: hypothetical protein HUU21_07515 [Polyangiaceae bacterium]|nr:hypothetical protein [Polyangiaceae bacterium]
MLDVLRSGLVLAAIGGSFALTYQLGYVNLAFGDVIVFGGTLAWWVYRLSGGSLQSISGGSLLAAASAAAVAGAACNLLVHRGVLDPLLQRSMRMPQVLASLGVSLILSSATGLLFGVQQRNLPIPQVVMTLGGSVLRASDIGLLALLLIAFTVLRSGRWLLPYQAAASNRALAGLWGVELGSLSFNVALMSGAVAGLLGCHMILSESVRPGAGIERMLLAFAGVLVGRPSGLRGMLLGSFGVGVGHHALAILIAPWFSMLGVLFAVGVILLVRREA